MKKIGNYRRSWGFLKEIKVYFLIVSIIFVVFALIGFIFPIFFVDLIAEFVKRIAEQTSGLGFSSMLFFILSNNISTAFFGMIFGVLLGIFPVFNAVLNGYVLGFVMNKTAEVAGTSILLRLLPHGIFELPALIISLGLGLRLGMFILAKNKKKDFLYALENCFRVFLFIVVPLLLVAGVIETWLIFILS